MTAYKVSHSITQDVLQRGRLTLNIEAANKHEAEIKFRDQVQSGAYYYLQHEFQPDEQELKEAYPHEFGTVEIKES